MKNNMIPQRNITFSLFCFLWPILLSHAFVRGGFCIRPTGITVSSSSSSLRRYMSTISSGDTVVVVGGSGGLGQLVTSKLVQANYNVRVTSRNPTQAQETTSIITSTTNNSQNNVSFVTLDLVNENDQQLEQALHGAAAIVISVGTTAFPTIKWKDGNTPKAIDAIAVSRLVQVACQLSTLKKIVLVTSIGVDRTDQMPFKILNLFGVLDAKKMGEDAVRNAVLEKGGKMDYAIIRPGRLIGGPFTNLDVAKLLQIEGGAENGVNVAAGDVLLGDCKRDACAEAIVQCLTNAACSNVEFSIVSNDEKALTVDQWTTAFQNM